jgi:hypothetical protein
MAGPLTISQKGGLSASPAWNVLHFYMLLLDGVYVENDYGGLRFQRVNAPGVDELKALVHAISHRVARFLEKRGFLERDAHDCMDAGVRATHGAVAESSYLALEPDDDDAMAQLQGHSITYRIAVGPQQGRKVFTLQ